MEVRILGPLEVWAGEREIEIGGGRQRALLAILVLRANEVVSSDRLIEELWGGAPPPTATKALQGLVSQLRRSLGSDAELLTRAPGYVLRLDGGSVDSERFETLLAKGRALREEEPGEAGEALRQALQLWRGPPLAEFAFEPFAQAEIRRLDELRLEALEERIEADLALGEHGRLVGDLEELVAENPLRERLRAQLMLALYRAGRQAEALDVYREGRRLLVGELGIEPGQPLQRLEKAILSQDPALDPPPAPQRAPTAAASRESVRDAPLVEPAPPGVPAEAAARRRRRLSGRRALIGAAVLAAAAVAVVVPLVLAGGRSAEPVVVVPDSLVRIDPGTNEIVEVVPVGNWPDEVAAVGDYVFVTNVDDGTVSRLDTGSGEVQTFAAGVDAPVSLAAEGEATLWIGSNSAPEVARVNAETLKTWRTVAFEGRSATWIAVGGGLVWATHEPAGSRCVAPERTSAADLTSGQVRWNVETGVCPRSIAYGEGAAWVVNIAESTVTRIDGQDGSAEDFEVGNKAGDVTTGFGSVWVTSDDDDAVWRLSPLTGKPDAIVTVGDLPWSVITGAGSVWVSAHGPPDQSAGTVSRIDPESDEVLATIELGFYPNGVTVAPDGIWVAVAPTDLPAAAG